MTLPASSEPQTPAAAPPARPPRSRVAVGWAVRVLMIALAAGAVWWSYGHAQARNAWRQAQLALTEDDPERALEHLHRCLPRWGERGDVRLLAAKAARLSGRLDEAEEHVTACERLPRGAGPAGAVRRERALLQVWQGDLGENLNVLAPEGVTAPNIPAEVLEAAAHGFDELSDDDTALACLRRLCAENPNHWRGHYLAGDILARTSRAEEAVPELERAVAAAPHAPAPRRRLAEALIDVGHVREAARHLDALHDRHPYDAGVAFLRARVLVYRGRPDEAQTALAQVLAKEPGHVAALVERGRLDFRAAAFERAREQFRAATERDPSNLDAWHGLANCHEAEGRAGDAAACREEAARVLREAGAATRMFRELSQRRGRNEPPPDPARLLELADRCDRVGMTSKASALRLQALFATPDKTRARLAVAAQYERTGRSHLAARQRALAGQ